MKFSFRFRNKHNDARRYADVLGEIHATELLIQHYATIIADIDPHDDWWGFAELKETIKQLAVDLDHLRTGAARIKPEGWQA